MKEWNYTDDILPVEDKQYLTVLKGSSYIQVLCWNEHYQVWDDADGDDYAHDKDAVHIWMEFPDLPKDFKISKETK